MKTYFLGNYTQDLVVDQFKRLCKKENLDLDIYVSGFNQYRQEIIDPNSNLYQLNPDIVYISLDLFLLTEDFVYNDKENKLMIFKERINELLELFETMKSNLSESQIFIDNFQLSSPVLMATIEYNSKVSFSEIENIANRSLVEFASTSENVSIVDVKNLFLQYGANELIDDRMHYLAKSHWSLKGLKELSKLYFRYFKAFKGIRKKCVVLDLDNTLWGGIIGDDGIENIILSNDGEGKAFFDFQRELLKLYNRGILLAINSKNTEEIVLETMKSHPNMVLKPEHFISMKINWNNKAQNMKEIADEINIGLDSLIFLDDSEFEREVVSTQFPEVLVPDLPKDFSEYPNFIRSLDVFDFLSLTNDDFARNKMYKANVQRDQLKKSTISIEDFYYSLDMVATIGIIDDFQVPRIAQMTQKTNQFNLRTQRYTDAAIKNFLQNPDYEVYFLSLADKYGDNGIVGTAIVKIEDTEAFIDSFIFSCRVLGRTAESALLNYVIENVANKGLKKLVGEYIPTKKNLPCKEFYAEHQFVNDSNNYWTIDLEKFNTKPLPWIKINHN